MYGQQIPQAQQHYILGLTLEREDKLGEAALEFTRAIEINPEFADAYFELGQVEIRRGNRQHAIRTLTQLMEFDSKNNRALLLLAQVYSDSGELDHALALYSKALEKMPADATIYYKIGMIAFQEKDYSQSEVMLTKALSLDPSMNDARRALVSALEASGNDKAAIERLQEAILLEPQAPDLMTNLGELYIKTGNLHEAENEFSKVLSIQSGFVPARLGVGTVYRLTGGLPAAIAVFSGIIRDTPTESRAYLERGRAEYAAGNIVTARSDFETYSRMAKDHPEGNYFLGILDTAAGDYTSAITHLKKALASDPNLADAYYYLAQAFFHLDRQGEAIEALQRCLSLDASNHAALELLSRLRGKETAPNRDDKQLVKMK